MSIMDFILIGAVLLFALIGIVKGGAKIFFGLFMLLIIMVGSAFLSSLICPLFLQKGEGASLEYTKPATMLMKPIDKALPDDGTFGELLGAIVTQGEDGVMYVGEQPLKTFVAEKIPYVGTFVASIVEKTTIPNNTLRRSISFLIARSVYEAAVWLILVILLVIVRNVFRKKIYRFLDHHSLPSKIDRAIGLAMSLTFLLALLWGAGLLLARFDDGANWAHTANTFILNGKISEKFFTANPLLKLIHVSLPVPSTAE